MKRFGLFILCVSTSLAMGCAMCQSPDDYTYGATGGRWQRVDPCYGRVGSIFTPEVGTQVAAETASLGVTESYEYPVMQSETIPDGTVYVEEVPSEEGETLSSVE